MTNLCLTVILASCAFLARQISLVSTCDLAQLSLSITGIVNETVFVECGAKNCNGSNYDPSKIYLSFNDSDLYNDEPFKCHNTAECTNVNHCYRKCSLKLKEIMDNKNLYCFLAASSFSRSLVPLKQTPGIPIHIQKTLNEVTDFQIDKLTDSHISAIWNMPADVLDGISIDYEVTYSSYTTCFPVKAKTGGKSTVQIPIRYEDTCDFSSLSIKPIANSDLEGKMSLLNISVSPSKFIIDCSVKLWLFLEDSENDKMSLNMTFMEKDNCSCPAHSSLKAEVTEDSTGYNQTVPIIHHYDNETCYAEVNNLNFTRKRIIQLRVALVNNGGRTTQLYNMGNISTFDSQKALFNETGPMTQCLTVIYAGDTKNLMKGSIVTFKPLYNKTGLSTKNSSIKINVTKPLHSDKAINCSLTLDSGVYDMCVADYGETECAIQETIYAISNPSHVTTSTVTLTSSCTTEPSNSICTNTTIPCTGDDGCGPGIGIGIVIGIFIGFSLCCCIGTGVLLIILKLLIKQGTLQNYLKSFKSYRKHRDRI